jgi:hypothetical protein
MKLRKKKLIKKKTESIELTCQTHDSGHETRTPQYKNPMLKDLWLKSLEWDN